MFLLSFVEERFQKQGQGGVLQQRTKEDIWPVSNMEKGVPKVISGKANVTRVGNQVPTDSKECFFFSEYLLYFDPSKISHAKWLVKDLGIFRFLESLPLEESHLE